MTADHFPHHRKYLTITLLAHEEFIAHATRTAVQVADALVHRWSGDHLFVQLLSRKETGVKTWRDGSTWAGQDSLRAPSDPTHDPQI